VVNHLCNPDSFFAKGSAIDERAELSMTYGKVGTGANGGQEHLTEALAASRSVEERYGLSVAVDRLAIVALGLVGSAEVHVRQCV
jgi:hypothetical protein